MVECSSCRCSAGAPSPPPPPSLVATDGSSGSASDWDFSDDDLGQIGPGGVMTAAWLGGWCVLELILRLCRSQYETKRIDGEKSFSLFSVALAVFTSLPTSTEKSESAWLCMVSTVVSGAMVLVILVPGYLGFEADGVWSDNIPAWIFICTSFPRYKVPRLWLPVLL